MPKGDNNLRNIYLLYLLIQLAVLMMISSSWLWRGRIFCISNFHSVYIRQFWLWLWESFECMGLYFFYIYNVYSHTYQLWCVWVLQFIYTWNQYIKSFIMVDDFDRYCCCCCFLSITFLSMRLWLFFGLLIKK